ncbi:hypothetical protein O7598_17310 [Micromonospora sp. WMMC241]|uniref:hypothetical protein n=1 Tax=Micromonospora sp. WMMC241 TaxID=3015159 RepID=UPI0022B6B855|nr:hypothetical protein [Micromonospora sp. WMMC241]MCZ7438172.1 hypothetical protein [Micromonospora sp. WMMC241]
MTIEFVGGDAEINSSFRERLSGAGRVAANGGSVVAVRGWADCERIGAQLVHFIAGRSEAFKLRIDGPGADFLVHEVRMVADAGSMTSFLASSAYLQ